MEKVKKVETIIISVKSEEKLVYFQDIILSSRLNNAPFTSKGKTTKLDFVEDKGDYVTGIVVTTRQIGLPAKHDMKANTFSTLGLSEDEGLAYGNVFIYDKNLQTLMYEVNRNGTFLTEFISYVVGYCCRTDPFGYFNIETKILLNIQAYEKMMSMRYYKKIEFEIAQPTKFIIDNESVENATKVAKGLNADYIKVEMGIKSKVVGGGLVNRAIQEVISAFLSTAPERDSHVSKLRVSGLEENPENTSKSRPSFVDLLLDKYLCQFNLEEPSIAKNIQVVERKRELKQLYLDCKSDFQKIVQIQEKL